jgi:hypothetical protein
MMERGRAVCWGRGRGSVGSMLLVPPVDVFIMIALPPLHRNGFFFVDILILTIHQECYGWFKCPQRPKKSWGAAYNISWSIHFVKAFNLEE